MDRGEVLHWLEEHPREVHGAPSEIVDRCEAEVRRHAAENAWGAAKAYVEGRMHEWEQEWGCHATESSVARTVCPMLANELKRHEPLVRPGSGREWAGPELLAVLDPEARQKVIEWVRELAQDVEHRIWKEVVRFTRNEAKSLVRAGRVSDDDSYEATENFAHKAAHVAQLLIEDYERQASH
jgi:hypothetical protein